MDPGSLPTTTTTTRLEGATMQTLVELRAQLLDARDQHPELERGINAALAAVDRRLGLPPTVAPRRERRGQGLR